MSDKLILIFALSVLHVPFALRVVQGGLRSLRNFEEMEDGSFTLSAHVARLNANKTTAPESPWVVAGKPGVAPRENACEEYIPADKLPPLTYSHAKGELQAWCEKAWPDEGATSASLASVEVPHEEACSSTQYASSIHDLMNEYGDSIMLPSGSGFVRYELVNKEKNFGGAANGGIFLLQKVDSQTPFPEKLLLKVPKPPVPPETNEMEYETERECMRGIAGVKGTVPLYSSAFKLGDVCYKGLVQGLVKGKDWGAVMPLSKASECSLQMTAGRLLCAFAKRGYAEMDWNNPGNFMKLDDETGDEQFVRIDPGNCFRKDEANVKYSKWIVPESFYGNITLEAFLDLTKEDTSAIMEKIRTKAQADDTFFKRILLKPVLAKQIVESDQYDNNWQSGDFLGALLRPPLEEDGEDPIPGLGDVPVFLSIRDLILNSQERVASMA
jgi:hypothetical protein